MKDVYELVDTAINQCLCGAVSRYQREGKAIRYIKKYGGRGCTCKCCGGSSFRVEEA